MDSDEEMINQFGNNIACRSYSPLSLFPIFFFLVLSCVKLVLEIKPHETIDLNMCMYVPNRFGKRVAYTPFDGELV